MAGWLRLAAFRSVQPNKCSLTQLQLKGLTHTHRVITSFPGLGGGGPGSRSSTMTTTMTRTWLQKGLQLLPRGLKTECPQIVCIHDYLVNCWDTFAPIWFKSSIGGKLIKDTCFSVASAVSGCAPLRLHLLSPKKMSYMTRELSHTRHHTHAPTLNLLSCTTKCDQRNCHEFCHSLFRITLFGTDLVSMSDFVQNNSREEQEKFFKITSQLSEDWISQICFELTTCSNITFDLRCCCQRFSSLEVTAGFHKWAWLQAKIINLFGHIHKTILNHRWRFIDGRKCIEYPT